MPRRCISPIGFGYLTRCIRAHDVRRYPVFPKAAQLGFLEAPLRELTRARASPILARMLLLTAELPTRRSGFLQCSFLVLPTEIRQVDVQKVSGCARDGQQ